MSNELHDGFDSLLDEFLIDEEEIDKKKEKESKLKKSILMPASMAKVKEKEKEKQEEEDSLFISVEDDYEEDEIEEEEYQKPKSLIKPIKEGQKQDMSTGLSAEMKEALEWEPEFPLTTPDRLINEWHTTGWVGYLHIDKILTDAIFARASDVHIAADLRVSMTINGEIERCDDYPIPDNETMHELIHSGILKNQQQQVFNRELELGASYTLKYGPFQGRRTRLTVGKTFDKYFLVFRIIDEYIPKLKDLNVEPELIKWSMYPRGMFLLCGPTGSGKSTTLASLIQNIQYTTKKKIITIENPIEYIYDDNAPSLVVQRAVNEDTMSFSSGLTSAMRQSPNIILLGEIRNTEETEELIRAGETAHLAISTMHTNSATTTLNRIRNLFSGNDQSRIMSTLSDILVGVGNQVLVKKPDGSGRFAVRELLTVNREIREMIANSDIKGIRDYQIRMKSTIEHGLVRAIKEDKCTIEDARDHITDPELFEELLAENGLTEENTITDH